MDVRDVMMMKQSLSETGRNSREGTCQYSRDCQILRLGDQAMGGQASFSWFTAYDTMESRLTLNQSDDTKGRPRGKASAC